MADLNDLNKPDGTSNYSTEVWQTVRGHVARLWSGDYTGMGNLVAGMRRWVRVGTTDAKLVQRNSAGGEDVLFDSSLKANAADVANSLAQKPKTDGTGATGSWPIDVTGSAAKLGGVAASSYLRSVNGAGPDANGNVAVSVDQSGRVAKSGDTMTGTLTVPALTISSAANYLNLNDTSTGRTRYLHHNEDLMGFLDTGGSWAMYENNSGQVWTKNYGWLHDKFAAKNDALRQFSANQTHFDQGGNIPGQKRLCTRTDGSQFWLYESNSSNCNCNCDCTCAG